MDLSHLQHVADLVASERGRGHGVLVVVSAMGKTTEDLLKLAGSAAQPDPLTPARALPRRELDLLVSTGERVSMALLAIALHARGLDAASFTGSQAGILTEPRHFDARILEIRPARLLSALAAGKIAIVAGYQGMSSEREVTTLGRGGSDTTAVALAAVLQAERCDIYSDVDGIYTADPHQVSAARHLPAIDYATLHEMTAAGARVLNARAVDWGSRYQVAIHARRTADFAAGTHHGRETRVTSAAAASARAVIVNSKFALVSTRADALSALRDRLSACELNVRDSLVEAGRGYAAVPLFSAPDFSLKQRELAESALPELRVDEGFAEICAVGAGIGERAPQLRAELPLDARCVATERRFSAWVPKRQAAALERRWHDLWVEAA